LDLEIHIGCVSVILAGVALYLLWFSFGRAAQRGGLRSLRRRPVLVLRRGMPSFLPSFTFLVELRGFIESL
jgi:hypothetical protein